MAYSIIQDESEITPQASKEQLIKNITQPVPLPEPIRHLARTGARVAESTVGLPADIAKGVGTLGLGAANYLTQGAVPSYSEATKNVPFSLPTSEYLRENITKPLTGQALEPQNATERFADEVAGDFASLFLPGGLVKGASKQVAKRALKLAVGANLAKEGAELITGSPKVGAGVKAGALILSSLPGTRNKVVAEQQSLYNNAFKNLPKNEIVNAKPLEKQFEKFVESLGPSHPEREFFEKRLSEFKGSLSKTIEAKTITSPILSSKGEPITRTVGKAKQGGFIKPETLIKYKQNLNEWIPILEQRKEIKSANQLKRMVGMAKSGIEPLERKYPKFAKDYVPAEELSTALNKTGAIRKFFEKNPALEKGAKNPIVKDLFKVALGIASAKYVKPQNLLKVGATLAGAYGVRESLRTLQLLKDPTAFRIYKNVLSDALKNDSKAAARNVARLDRYANNLPIKADTGFDIIQG